MLTKNNNLSGKFQGLPISRMGITDKNEGRILAIVYMYDQIFDSALKGIDPSYLAKEISDFYVYEVDTGYGKKYVHIEKDDVDFVSAKDSKRPGFTDFVGEQTGEVSSIRVFEQGVPLDFDEDLAKKILSEDEVKIMVTLQDGNAKGTAWGCDLTYEYVKINGDYRTWV